MITVYGRTDSSNCAKVLWLLDAMGLRCRLVLTGGAHGGTDDPAYLALNPNGKVPTLVDGDVTVWESHAVMRHIARRYGPTPFYPQDFTARARVDMWLDWVATTLNPALGALRRAQDAAATEKALPAALSAFGILDQHLQAGPLMTGDAMTLADIAVAPHVMRWSRLRMPLPRLPHVERLHERLRQDPLFIAHVEDVLDRA